MIDLDTLNASRKADREKIAEALLSVAAEHGATGERQDEPPNPGYSGAGILLRFTLNGVGAMVDIDDLHGGETTLISWYNDYSGPEVTTKHFAFGFRAAANAPCSTPRPHHKATTCPDGWDDLRHSLSEGLALAAAREAFVEDCERIAA